MQKRNHFINRIFKLPLPLKERVFIFFRYISAPFLEIEKLIPQKAKILDVGCGHGLLELILKNKKNERSIIGIDIDKNKIKFAKKLKGKLKIEKLQFYTKSIFDLDNKDKFDCIIIFDVDYLLNNEEKRRFLEKIRLLLNKNGILIIKTVVKNKSLGYYLAYLQEILTVYLFKKTFTNNQQFYFLTVKEYKNILKSNKYKILKENKLRTAFYHPHYYFLTKIDRA